MTDLESKLKDIKDIIRQMEDPELPLEESFELYRKGVSELRDCREYVDGIEAEFVKIEEEGF